MNILIAVASKHGSTHEIAVVIGAELRAAGISVDVRNAADVDDLDLYDAIVLGSAIYAGRWLPDARRFAERHHTTLARLPVWVFSTGPLGTTDSQPLNNLQQLAASLDSVAIRDHRVFGGKLDRTNLDLVERIITMLLNAPDGDFRDWETIRAWARAIAAAVCSTDTLAYNPDRRTRIIGYEYVVQDETGPQQNWDRLQPAPLVVELHEERR